VLALCEALNPDRVPGRLTLISRMGADAVEDRLRRCCGRCAAGHPVAWACDPMHGNTFASAGGRKTLVTSRTSAPRSPASCALHRAESTWPGGVPYRTDR
jgi:3-deoxy-D-arabino-heptulosonate 7-phosphate (DAHP) synthase class II